MINIHNAVLHILDSTVNNPILSDNELELSSNYGFISKHIENYSKSSEIKEYDIEHIGDSCDLLNSFDVDFIDNSKKIAQKLFDILHSNVEIPAGDLLVVRYELESEIRILFLFLEYRLNYIHKFEYNEKIVSTDIILYKTCLINTNQKIANVFEYNCSKKILSLVEKEYNINGEKEFLLSSRLFNLPKRKTAIQKVGIMQKAAESIIKKHFENDIEKTKELKSEIIQACEENREIDSRKIIKKVFNGDSVLLEDFKNRISKHGVEDEAVEIDDRSYKKIMKKQRIKTRDGIEITIPVDLLSDNDKILFEMNADGTTNIIIKNGHTIL